MSWSARAAARTVETLTLAAWSAPEIRPLLAGIALAAAWLTYVSTLPSFGLPRVGVAIQALLWVLLFVVLLPAYGAADPTDRQSVRRTSRRLGASLLLALLTTHLARLVLAPLLAPAGWSAYHYVRLLLPLVLVALWCAALLPRETRTLVRSLAASRVAAPLPELVVLLAAAAALVSSTDLAFQAVRAGSVQARLAYDVVAWSAWLTNTLILFSVYILVFAVTSSAATALLLVSPIYATMVFATLVKIRYMHSAVQPLDLLSVPEFMPLFKSFFGTWALVASVVGIAAWIGALVVVQRRRRRRTPLRRRVAIGLAALALLLALPEAFFVASRIPRARLGERRDPVNATLLKLGAPDGEHREMARSSGILLTFLSELPAAFVSAPAGYSPAAVANTLRKYSAAAGAAPSTTRGGGRVNLVVYLVESLMDPGDLGLRFTSDPMPNLHALSQAQVGGYAIVPERFGGSANTEFETLTGMTRTFLPEGSLPYRQYLKRPTPALPRTLRELGYATVAVQADPKYYYDRERVYDLLGFDRVEWLNGAPGVQRADRGNWPSDEAVVDAVIRASQGARPFFVFAFPSSTHSPYNFGTYKNSDLDVLDAPSPDVAAEVKEYINAVRVADKAIGRLVEHFRHRPDSTVILVFGDHLPPLSQGALRTFSERLTRMSRAEKARETHRVPLVVWANFELPREEAELSVSMLPPFLLAKMGVARTGLFAVTDSVRRGLPVVSSYARTADGRLWDRDSLPSEQRALLEDYRLVQYDLLLGAQYALRAPGADARISRADGGAAARSTPAPRNH